MRRKPFFLRPPVMKKRIKGPLCWSDALATDNSCKRLATFDEDSYDVLVWDLEKAAATDLEKTFQALFSIHF